MVVDVANTIFLDELHTVDTGLARLEFTQVVPLHDDQLIARARANQCIGFRVSIIDHYMVAVNTFLESEATMGALVADAYSNVGLPSAQEGSEMERMSIIDRSSLRACVEGLVSFQPPRHRPRAAGTNN